MGIKLMKSLVMLCATGALSLLATLPAAYAGTKTINNNTSDTIKVFLIERDTDCSTNAGKVHVKIKPNSSANIDYPAEFINAVTISLEDASTASTAKETLACTAQGDVGTLDNAFNGNSIFEIGFAPFGITFSAHN
jgi:hypothetical protein